jgi:DNA-binding response OmpR family regulator
MISPSVPVEPPGSAGAAASSAASLRSTILLVDDDEMVGGLIAVLLRRAGLAVACARNGSLGLDYFNAHRPQIGLVLTDLRLPDMSGAELGRKIRLSDETAPILLCSGAIPPADWQNLMGGSGPAVFLPKPFSPGQVLREVRKLLDLGNRNPGS